MVAKMREETARVTREHKLFSGYRRDLSDEEFRLDSTPPDQEKTGYEVRGEKYKRL